jgi:hypothetical protein
LPRDLHNPNLQPVVDRSWCFLHEHWEPVYENNYRVCFECGHSYFTPLAVVFAHNEMMLDLWERWSEEGELRPTKVDDAASILSCPLCSHDW